MLRSRKPEAPVNDPRGPWTILRKVICIDRPTGERFKETYSTVMRRCSGVFSSRVIKSLGNRRSRFCPAPIMTALHQRASFPLLLWDTPSPDAAPTFTTAQSLLYVLALSTRFAFVFISIPFSSVSLRHGDRDALFLLSSRRRPSVSSLPSGSKPPSSRLSRLIYIYICIHTHTVFFYVCIRVFSSFATGLFACSPFPSSTLLFLHCESPTRRLPKPCLSYPSGDTSCFLICRTCRGKIVRENRVICPGRC